VTARIEEGIGRMSGEAAAGEVPAPAPLDPKARYFERLQGLVDTAALKRLPGPVAFDARYGTTRGWLDAFLEHAGVEVVRLHDRRDPLFGGGTPDCGGENLAELRDAVVAGRCALGLATDGDGDRFAIVDPSGEVVTPNLILALLADDILSRRRWPGGIGRTVATTHLLDRVAALHGREVHETAVGFKHFNPLLADGRIFMGAEESAGFSVRGHVPEKDGMLACLLAAEMTAVTGKGPLALAEDLYRRAGRVVSRRRDVRFDPARREELAARTRRAPERLAGGRVSRTVSLDGE
jgi:phosphoglucomutase